MAKVVVLLEKIANLLDDFIRALSECYELDAQRFQYNELRRRIYAEGRLYGEYIHTEALLVAENILLVTEYRLDTEDLHDRAPAHFVMASDAMQTLLRTLKLRYSRVLNRLHGIMSEIEKAREKLNENRTGTTTFRNRSVNTNITNPWKSERFTLQGTKPPGASMPMGNSYQPAAARPEFQPRIPVNKEETRDPARPNEGEIPQIGSKKRLIPSSPMNISFKSKNNKLGEEHGRHLFLVMQCLKTLDSAVQTLYEFLDPAEEYLSLMTNPKQECFLRLSIEARLTSKDLGEKVVNECKRLLLARMDQYVAFYGIKEKISDDHRKQWWRDIMEERAEI